MTLKELQPHMVSKARWAVECFGGLTLAEVIAREIIKARMDGNAFSLEQCHKVMRKTR